MLEEQAGGQVSQDLPGPHQGLVSALSKMRSQWGVENRAMT